VADALRVARRGQTTSLGHLLAPMAVRYIVVPLTVAPGGGRPRTPPAPDIPPGLAAQLDLKRIDTDASQLVYENTAWMPGRAALDAKASQAADGQTLAQSAQADLRGAEAVLTHEASPTTFTGRIDSPTDVSLSEASSPRWHLRGGGQRAERRTSFGWANAFTTDATGKATLGYSTSPVRWLALLIEVGFWFVLVRFLVRTRPRRKSDS